MLYWNRFETILREPLSQAVTLTRGDEQRPTAAILPGLG
jgi:hypothetical protein